MGAYTCEYGVVHKVCRCPTPHTIKCDKVAEHSAGYQPKHRAEPVIKYRVTLTEHDSWSGPDSWTEDFDTPAEANARVQEVNGKNTLPVVPDYYVTASPNIKQVTL